jgi:uncharacterized membrane protein YbhN (UPF0104 family)
MRATIETGQTSAPAPGASTERSRESRAGLKGRCDARRGARRQASVGTPGARAGSSGAAATPTTAAAPSQTTATPVTSIRRRLLVAVILATATVTLVLAVPPLRGAARQIDAMDPDWVLVAVVLEIASCVGYVVVFRWFFDQVSPGPARELAWTEEASGALLPTGGVGALAIGGWLLRQAGMSTRQIIERSSALFFFTSAANVAALVGGGAMLATGAMGGTDTVVLAGVPILIGAVSTSATLTVPIALRRLPRRHWPTWLVDMAAGIDGAVGALLHPSWRLIGAVAYLGCDIAALGAAFAATGRGIPIDVLVLGYIIGYIANMLPVPGGFGVLEAGLAGTLILYGAPATRAAAAVIVYHAIAFWIPSLGGLIGYAQLRRRPTGDVTQPSAEPTVHSTGSPA